MDDAFYNEYLSCSCRRISSVEIFCEVQELMFALE
jgi:hypothetical protein